MKANMTRINTTLLEKEIKNRRMNIGDFSMMIGKSSQYLTVVKSKGGKVPVNVEALICRTLDKPVGYFLADREPQTGGGESKILENIFKKLEEVINDIEEIKDMQDKIWNKACANTLQIRRLEDLVKEKGEKKSDKKD